MTQISRGGNGFTTNPDSWRAWLRRLISGRPHQEIGDETQRVVQHWGGREIQIPAPGPDRFIPWTEFDAAGCAEP